MLPRPPRITTASAVIDTSTVKLCDRERPDLGGEQGARHPAQRAAHRGGEQLVAHHADTHGLGHLFVPRMAFHARPTLDSVSRYDTNTAKTQATRAM